MSRILIYQKTIDEYAQGICEFIGKPGFFCTETFRRKIWKPSPTSRSRIEQEKVIGFKSIQKVVGRVWTLVNDRCAGRRTRPKERDLRVVMAIEGLGKNPHIHLVTESHPSLNKQILEKILHESSPATSPDAIDVKEVYDLESLSGYVIKEIDPENLVAGIEFFGPRERKS